MVVTVPETISAFRWSANTCRRLGEGGRERERERGVEGGREGGSEGERERERGSVEGVRERVQICPLVPPSL